jgi:uncharacterized protein involved in exopolysaccharide biosynthesis
MSDEVQIVSRAQLSRTPTARELAAVFFRHGRLLVGSFLAVFAAGLIYAVLCPSYKAEMKVLVRHGRIDPAVTPTATAPPLLDRTEVTEEELNSEAELLRDEDILRQVVIETGLDQRASWFTRWREQGREERIAWAVKRLGRKLDVQPAHKSQLIVVSYRTSDPSRAASVLNELANAYLTKHAEIERPNGQQAFFEQQVQQSRRALDRAEGELAAFTRKKKIVSAPLERDLALQKLSEAEAADLAIQSSIAEKTERIRALELNLQQLPERRVVQIRSADNPQLQEKLKSKLLDLQLRRTELLTRFEPSYRLVQEVDQQIAQAKSAIEAEELKPLRDETTEENPDHGWANSERLKALVDLQTLQGKHAVALAQVAAYRSKSERLGQGVITQTDLEEKVKAAEDKYLLYANKREEARIGDALDQTGILNVAIAQAARIPALPRWPLWAATCLSLAAACLFSTGAVFTADHLDPSFRTPGEVIAVLGTPVLAALPAAPGPAQSEDV